MALQVQTHKALSISMNSAVGSPAAAWSTCPTKQYVVRIASAADHCVNPQLGIRGGRLSLRVKSCSDASAATASTPSSPVVGQVTEVNNDTFWPLVNAAGDKTVVLDMYTQWCGPCKVIAPKYKALSKKYSDVVFLKLDCNQDNRPLAKELGIKVVPTFKILKDSKIVKEITGAKFDDLVAAIETVRST